MVRVIAYIAVVGVLVALGVWLADRPGRVALEWQGWRLDTSVPVLLFLLVVASGVLAVVMRALASVRGLPRWVRDSLRERRRRRGYAALGEGFVAIAAGDSTRAQKLAIEAGRKLDDPALTLLLRAQAAELVGDAGRMRELYGEMKARPKTELIGLKGLINEARREGRRDEILALADRAVAVKPVDWAVRTLFDELVAQGRWAEAEDVLIRFETADAYGAGELDRLRVVLSTQRALESFANGDRAEALRLARAALERDAAMIPAAVLAARLLAAEGKDRRAAGIVEDAWKRLPHPDLARAYFDIWPGDDPLRRTQRAERLSLLDPDHAESRLAVAEVALDAKLWGQARNQLSPLLGSGMSRRAARLMARLEQNERGEAAAANEWLRRAAEAPADPSWRCTGCGSDAGAWSARCGACGALDTLGWVVPSRALVVVGAGAPPAVAAAAE